MDDWYDKRLKDAELNDFLGRLFPHGFAAADVIQEIAPEGWENSPLLACFHPSPQQVFEQRRKQHRHLEKLRKIFPKRDSGASKPAPRPEPTMEQVLADWKPQPINAPERSGRPCRALSLGCVFRQPHSRCCRWPLGGPGIVSLGIGIFGRVPRGPPREMELWRRIPVLHGLYLDFSRADLTPVYRTIFRRLRSAGADWHYHFPRLFLVELPPLRGAKEEQDGTYSPSEAFANELKERQSQAELEQATLDEIHTRACREAMDRPPPASVNVTPKVGLRRIVGMPKSVKPKQTPAQAGVSTPLQGARARDSDAMRPATRSAKNRESLRDCLLEMRHMVRTISRQLDELEVILRAMDVLESNQAMRNWFNNFVPGLGARPIDLCRTARGRQAALRELGRIEHGVYS